MNNVATSVHDERPGDRSKPSSSKIILAIVLVGLMIVSGLVIVAPGAAPVKDDAKEPVKAGVQALGPREVTYTYANMFESYLKQTDTTNHGKHGTTLGLNSWWADRAAYYPDLVMRDKYPFTTLYDYYSANVPTGTPPLMAHGVYSLFREYMVAKNLTTVATGPNQDPQFIPMLNPSGLALDGGNVAFNWYITYLTAAETVALTAGTHYANTLWGVPKIGFGGANYNDGWWAEIQGTVTFDKLSAKKFLNLPAVANLLTEFNTANVGGALNNSWMNHWKTDGTKLGTFDLYATYDYSIDSGTVDMFLKGISGTTNSLTIQIWGHAWGYETLMMRFLEGKAGVMQYEQTYPEDFYLNGTFGTSGGDISLRATSFYRMMAWKDGTSWTPAWKIESDHTDACPNDPLKHPISSWASRYNPYAWTTRAPIVQATRIEWSPGTMMFGVASGVEYWQAPLGMHLITGEKLIIKLPQGTVAGYEPYRGAADNKDLAKVAELGTHLVWGEMVLGHGEPSDLSPYYNAATKTITIGPSTWTPPANSVYPTLNATSSPTFIFAISKVSTYKMEIVEAGPYALNQAYTLRVTAKNLSDATVTTWNGTVDLPTVAGVTYGATSHLYTPANAGVWQTTVTFTTSGDKVLLAKDRSFSADVDGSLALTIGPPPSGFGQLRVGTSPAAPSMISIDGQWASRWGLDWVKLTPGLHTIHFGDVFGFMTPADQQVTIVDGQITEIQGVFTPCALLRVVTSPAMPSTIYVNSIPRNDWGIWNYVPAGTYTVSFGAVAGFNTPNPQTVTLGIGESAVVTGTFTSNPSAPGPDPATYGQLRVGTNPAVPTMIYANGNWMSHWGLDWVKLAPGSYLLTFGDVNGVATAAPHTVTIVAGQITEYVADFPLRGTLQVATSPAAPSTIYVDGIARNDWGIWVDVNPGSYVVSFGAVPGWVTPLPQTVTVVVGQNTLVWGVFVPG